MKIRDSSFRYVTPAALPSHQVIRSFHLSARPYLWLTQALAEFSCRVQCPAFRNSPLNQFVSELLANYQAANIVQPHDLYFTYQVLYESSLHLLGFSVQNELDQTGINLILRLQATFPGAAATLAVSLSRNDFNPSTDMLPALAKPYLDRPPVEANSFQEALFFYYLWLVTEERSQSQQFLARSAETYPDAGNPDFRAGRHRPLPLTDPTLGSDY